MRKRFCRLAIVLGILKIPFEIAIASSADVIEHSQAEGAHHVHGSHEECPLPRSAQDVVACAQENHPAVLRSKAGAAYQSAGIGFARQIPNPQVEVQTVHGKPSNNYAMQTQISLVQPLEIGGKRSGRIKEAEARSEIGSAELKQIQSDVRIETILNLYRLGQIAAEKAMLNETINTMGKLIRQHRSRPTLPPEQEVSLIVFEVVSSDANLRLTTLTEEEKRLEHYFHISTGHSLDEIEKVLPASPKSWPQISDSPKQMGVSPWMQRLQAEQGLALGQLESARGAAWPTLGLGPMMQLERDPSGNSAQMFGLQLNLELPVFNLNGGGREYAAKGLARADRSVEIRRAEETHERSELVRVYRSSVAALNETPPLASLHGRHRRIETLTLRGLISGSLVVESHRSMIELQKARNERELDALRTLWEIYRIEGRVFEESI